MRHCIARSQLDLSESKEHEPHQVVQHGDGIRLEMKTDSANNGNPNPSKSITYNTMEPNMQGAQHGPSLFLARLAPPPYFSFCRCLLKKFATSYLGC